MGYENVYQFPWGWQGWQEFLGIKTKKYQGLQVGDVFPDLRFSVITGDVERQYLGLTPGARAFSIAEINSPYLLVVVYDELCLTCQMELTTLKSFFKSHPPSEAMGSAFKVLGIAVGSTDRAVAKYGREREVPFPLAADTKRQLFHLLGSPILPTLYVLKKMEGQTRILWTYAQKVETPEKLTQMLFELLDRERSQPDTKAPSGKRRVSMHM